MFSIWLRKYSQTDREDGQDIQVDDGGSLDHPGSDIPDVCDNTGRGYILAENTQMTDAASRGDEEEKLIGKVATSTEAKEPT